MAGSGGSWKVAYADFVTAMMAFFLVMWLASQEEKIKEAIQRTFENPFRPMTLQSTGIIPNEDILACADCEGQPCWPFHNTSRQPPVTEGGCFSHCHVHHCTGQCANIVGLVLLTLPLP